MTVQLKKILKSLQKTLSQLDALVQQNDKAIAENTVLLDRIHDDNLSLLAERQRAKNVGTKLRNLLEA